MADLPNIQHSHLLHSLTSKHNLTDLYRVFNPIRKDYTFIPKSKDQSNRSRIDFILVSEVLIQFAHECDILPSLQNNLFDHKAVYVNFFVKKSPGQRTTIAASVLKDPMVDLLVNRNPRGP